MARRRARRRGLGAWLWRFKDVIVQCKRYAPGYKVGSRELQGFIGMVAIHHRADYGIFVTTSDFTAPARGLATEHGVRLIDGPKLGAMVEESRRGTLAAS